MMEVIFTRMFKTKKINYVPRDYQINILKEIKNMNTIVYLPPGSGKTLIAAMLMKEMGESLTKPFENGRKWTYFIVRTLNDGYNKCQFLENYFEGTWNVMSVFTINSKKLCRYILEKYQIMILTEEVFLDNLQRNFIKVKDINLIVFNQCYYALKNDQFKKIMKFIWDDTNKCESPRILGLTNTLICSNVKQAISEFIELQQMFNASIKTSFDDHLNLYSIETTVLFNFYDEHILNKDLIESVKRIKLIINQLSLMEKSDKGKIIKENQDIYYIENEDQYIKPLMHLFLNIKTNLMENGVYIAFLATSHFIVDVEKKKKLIRNSKSSHMGLIFSMVVSELTVIRKMLYDNMKKDTKNPETYNISPKLKELMNILSFIKCTDIYVIVIDCQTTAKFLLHFIKDYLVEHKKENIVCDCFASSKGDLMESNDLKYYQSINDEIMNRFNNREINILIVSKVEENFNFEICKYVIKYNFSVYYLYCTQRITHCDKSKFIIMLPNLIQMEEMNSEYIPLENEINETLLQYKTDDDDDDDDDNDGGGDGGGGGDGDDDDYKKYLNEVYKTQFCTVTHKNANKIINEYCSSLPQNNFTNWYAEWYIMKCSDGYYKCKVKLPYNNVVKTTIDGLKCKNKYDAKRSAAFNACIELHKANVLDDYMSLIKQASKSVINHSYWYPHWDEEDIEGHKYECLSGNKKIKRMVDIAYPSFLHQAYPKIAQPSYLHVIHVVPAFDIRTNSKYNIFDEILKTNKLYGILTSKKLPCLSNFPIFLHNNAVCNIRIEVNVGIIVLDQENYKKLETFHTKLFLDFLGVNEFLCRSYSDEKNSYLIAPINSSDNTYNVDWNVIDTKTFIETEVYPTMKQMEPEYYEEFFKTHVFSPLYKHMEVEKFIVTNVITTPRNILKTFRENYGSHKTNETQPLITAKLLRNTDKIHFLTPVDINNCAPIKANVGLFIPELCNWYTFPSIYWYKALMLPAILNRFNQLLLAEDLIVKINCMCDIKVDKNVDTVDTIKIDRYCDQNYELKNIPTDQTINDSKYSLNTVDDESNLSNSPNDIELQINTNVLDTLNHDMAESNQNGNDPTTINIEKKDVVQHMPADISISTNNEPSILTKLKHHSDKKIGPRQSDILKTLTLTCTQDIFNNERMETYGDSFIKFAISLVLYEAFPFEDEGFYSDLRKKICSNRNLFYIGRHINIGSYLMVHKFSPQLYWTPPCFDVHKKIKDIFEKNRFESTELHKIIMTKDEQFSGEFSNTNWHNIITKLSVPSNVDNNVSGYTKMLPTDIFLHKQLVSDKIVADCIESLIGTYVHHCGVEDGFKILCNLGIIPKEFTNVHKSVANNNDAMDFPFILPGYKIIEQRIGYTFKNKNLLTEAFIHPSYHQVVNYNVCYQRLEFIGDSIIDYLITKYVIENYKTKTPGEISDIRSSIVNNSVFASITTRIGLHTFILLKNLQLMNAIDKFYEHQLKWNHSIHHKIISLLKENYIYAAESIYIPKVLGDVFEALIGAIYLDCNKDLNLIWKIFYGLLKNEINELCTTIILNPLHALHDSKFKSEFSQPIASEKAMNKGFGTMIKLDVTVNNAVVVFYGFGQNIKEAKISAAVIALKFLNG